jgi:hypothetical protein
VYVYGGGLVGWLAGGLVGGLALPQPQQLVVHLMHNWLGREVWCAGLSEPCNDHSLSAPGVPSPKPQYCYTPVLAELLTGSQQVS